MIHMAKSKSKSAAKSTTKSEKVDYDIQNDHVVSAVAIVCLDAKTGAPVGAPGEGVMPFSFCLRSLNGGEIKLSMGSAYPSKGSANARLAWVIGPDGRATCRKPVEGEWVVSSFKGRLTPALAASVGAYMAHYAANLTPAKAA